MNLPGPPIAITPNTAQTLAKMPCSEFETGSVNGWLELYQSALLSPIMDCLPTLAYRCSTQKGATMMIEKQVLVPDRVRRLPTNDWSWVDRRFLREFSSKLSGDAVFLYLFLAAVADKNGLSYYSDNALALRLRTTEGVINKAREDLLNFDLIAYRAPLAQVLSLPRPATERSSQLQLRSLIEQLHDCQPTEGRSQS
jgi:hypothetical protein